MTPRITVPAIGFVSVICWDGSFRENFDGVLCALNQTLPKDTYELIFVEYYERANPQILALAEQHENVQVAALGNSHPGKENEHSIGACVNEGLRRARGDLIVIPDADVVFEEDFLEEVVRQHERYEELALYFYRMDEPETAWPVPRSIEELKKVGRIRFAENYGGCLAVRKKWLEEINGYEEDDLWRGYASQDQDTARRLKTLGLSVKWHPSKFLYHGHHTGCHSPDPQSLKRIYVQREIFRGREQALETLPDKGLDPGRKPKWRYRAEPRPMSPPLRRLLGFAIRGAAHRLLPRSVRLALRRLLA
ncbi:MAG: glycosyltransferase family 2 protein, partial [Candidatus Brocadiae bacterium]|nr:glycosyltransferase family 2 protein [Candidatus Brocadiia bacterium]